MKQKMLNLRPKIIVVYKADDALKVLQVQFNKAHLWGVGQFIEL